MLFSGVFWGIVLIFAGISVLVKVFFNIDIPVFRVIFGLFVIALGLSILLGRPVFKTGNHEFHYTSEAGVKDEYNVIFGKGITDLSTLSAGAGTIEVNTIFGDNTLVINPAQPVHIRVESVFAGAVMPDGNTTAFGTYHYRTKKAATAKDALYIKATVVFGSLRVAEKNPD